MTALLLIGTALTSGCSVRQYAVDMVGDMLAGGDSVYSTEDDLELVAGALPFGLKLIESLLAQSPRHRGLLVAASRGYVLYAYVYVSHEAEVAADDDLERARTLRVRAARLYLRANGYALRALDVAYPGASEALAADPSVAMEMIEGGDREADVENLYWAAASLGLAISASKSQPALLARLPEVEALLARAMTLDESWGAGVLHEFAIAWAAAPGSGSGRETQRSNYERALQLSQGRRASLFVSYAENVSVPAQDRTGFETMLERALAIDPDAHPELRLENTVAQRRSRWLLGRADLLFLE